MEDSIEDYLRISKNIKDNFVNEDVTRKEILTTAQRKKEYEAYAVKIVIFLLDGKLRPEIFLKCLKYINQDYYQDVVEERAVSKLCGYPLCGKKINDILKQKYIISTKTNKVYDISERKNFCSNFCYKASMHVKEQIDVSPLWLRNHKHVRDCSLLPASVLGTPGEEIDQGITKPPPELPNFTSVSQFTQFSLEEVGEMEESGKKNGKYKIHKQSLDVIKEDDGSDNENELENHDIEDEESSDDEIGKYNVNEYNEQGNINVKQNEKCQKYANKGNLDVHVKKKKTECVKKQDTIPMNEKEKLEYLISKLKINNERKIKLVEPSPMKASTKQQLNSTSETTNNVIQEIGSSKSNLKEIQTSALSDNNNEILRNVIACLHEWITLDTFIYIYGEDEIKQVLNENKMGEYFDQLKITELDRMQQLKYMNICRRLHMQELAEAKFDNAVVGYALKPLPDFKQLKAEVQGLDLKVKSFYKGVLYETPDTNFPTKPVKENEANESGTAVLPPVDVNAQNALRRKVLLCSINQTLQILIKELKLEKSKVLTSIQELVKSFKLKAHNIVFKPAGWSLVVFILIKILSLKDKSIDEQLKQESSAEYLDLIMSRYSEIENNIEDILTILKNVDKFVETYITQNSEP